MDVHKGKASLHCEPHAPVVRVIGVGTAISVAEEAVRTKRVVVWTVRGCGNGQRNVAHHLRLEDALRTDQWYAYPVELKPFSEQLAWQYVAMQRDLIRQPREGGTSYACVISGVEHLQWLQR